MNLTLENLYYAIPVINKILQIELPFKTSYKLRLLVKELESHVNTLNEYKESLAIVLNDTTVNEEVKKKKILEFEELIKIQIQLNFTGLTLEELENIKISPLYRSV